MTLQQQKETAVWVAQTLFKQRKTSGTTGNLSFRYGNSIFVTASNCCFGALTINDFAMISLDGKIMSEIQPSKEYPLHLMLYTQTDIQAVIHTHSYYAVLWSLFADKSEPSCVPSYTPYLKLKLGNVRLVPYAPPGSQQLFQHFQQALGNYKGYLLKNHGPFVGGSSLKDAFASIEELEESSKLAWDLRNEKITTIS